MNKQLCQVSFIHLCQFYQIPFYVIIMIIILFLMLSGKCIYLIIFVIYMCQARVFFKMCSCLRKESSPRMGNQFPPTAIPPSFNVLFYYFYCMDSKALLNFKLILSQVEKELIFSLKKLQISALRKSQQLHNFEMFYFNLES